jgi:hypothetical protein
MIPIVWIWKLCLLRENNKAPKHTSIVQRPQIKEISNLEAQIMRLNLKTSLMGV